LPDGRHEIDSQGTRLPTENNAISANSYRRKRRRVYPADGPSKPCVINDR